MLCFGVDLKKSSLSRSLSIYISLSLSLTHTLSFFFFSKPYLFLFPSLFHHQPSGVNRQVVEGLETEKYPFVMCNFAPPDMVGHTGNYEAAVKAVEATDKAIGTIYEACKRLGYVLFITADHGNAEQMISEAGGPHTAHTCNMVPFIMSDNARLKFDEQRKSEDIALCDVAPTILTIMGLDIPADMESQSLC